MPLTYPLTRAAFQDRLRIGNARPFALARFEEISGLGTGEIITAIIAAPKWEAEFALSSRLTYAQAAEALALLEALGTSRTVELYDVTQPFPAADPGGALLGGASPTVSAIGTDNSSLRITGLPPAYVITIGDMISIGYSSGSRRALFRAGETVTASAGGVTPMFSVAPHLPAGLSIGASVTLARPYGWFRVVPGSFDPGVSTKLGNSGVRFRALQVMAA